MSAGILLLVAGSWVLTQVLRGNALQRLGILPNTQASGPADSGGFKIPWPISPGGPVGGAAAGGAQKAGQIIAGGGV